MKVYFYDKKRDSLISKVIKKVTGTFNHVSIGYDTSIQGEPLERRYVFEAISGRIGQSGVFSSDDPKDFHQGKHAANITEIDLGIMPNETKARHFLLNQVGKKYDFGWFVSFVFFWVQGKADAWGCSELAYKAICIGYGVEHSETKISPSELYDLCNLLNAKIK